jgi:hypothetical protein
MRAPGGNHLGALTHNRLGKYNRGCRAVARDVIGFRCNLTTICAPMFSNLSASSISFATLLSSTTLRPFGAQCDFCGVGEDVHAARHALPTIAAEPDFLGSHVV